MRLWRTFLRGEDGAATLPALLWLPFYIMIAISSVEMGVLIVKQTLFDRGVDLSVRILRLGISSMPTHDGLKKSICGNIGFISNCMDRLAVEVFPVDTVTWTTTNSRPVMCTDSTSQEPLAPTLDRGSSNQLMIIRACLKIDTMMEINPMALALKRDAGGQTALIAISSFVNEPRGS